MDGKRTSVPLYLHITLLSFGLVLATGLVLRWFGDAIPGVAEFGLLLGAVAVGALVASRRLAPPLGAFAKGAGAGRPRLGRFRRGWWAAQFAAGVGEPVLPPEAHRRGRLDPGRSCAVPGR